MAVVVMGNSGRLINPDAYQTSPIYDPTLPSRVTAGSASITPITTVEPGQGPQYNPSFGSDQSPTGTAPPSGTYPPSFPITADYKPSFDTSAPLSSILASQSVKGNYLNRSLGNVDARGAPYPMRSAARGPNVNRVFSNLPEDTFDNAVQTAQAPAPATPQGWNLFTALGQALGHLLGFNAAGQPQGMTGLIRPNPVQTGAPAQTGLLRMPNNAARYMGRTLIG